MFFLWLIASVLVVGTLGVLIPFFLRAPKGLSLNRDSINVEIARERETELKHDLKQGLISDAEYDASRHDLEQGLTFDLSPHPESSESQLPAPFAASIVSALIPILAFGIYIMIGSPDVVNVDSLSLNQTAPSSELQPDVDTMLAQMKKQLEDRPDDVRGWTLLANALMGTGRYAEAVEAYRVLRSLQPDNPEILIRLADAIAMTQNGMLAGEAEQLITRALAISPDQPQGLWLSGIAAEQRGKFDEALMIFNRLLSMVANEPDVRIEVEAVIARIRQAQDQTSAIDPIIEVKVDVPAELIASIRSNDTLFVFVKDPNGPPMPIAARRLSALPLPRVITLSDGDRLTEGNSLSNYPQLVIGALISKSGSATKSSGDLVGLSQTFSMADQRVIQISLNERVE
ncbi:MAG: c-type cytochrome biogenesis protein CcmI [Proteobacteria bacterium]|nr:c-type cytochrome biogenesis protein CcmI [Pseudomonadota bacterium]